MASITITNHVAKWFSNKTSWTKFTWWKTSFNMPVTNIFDNNTTYTETEWILNAIGEATSFDCSWFEAWWEAVCLSTVFTVYWPFAWWTVNCKQEWKNSSGTVTGTQNVDLSFPSLASEYWGFYQLAFNTGIASWEVDSSQTQTVVWTASNAISGSSTNSITFTQVPNTSTTYTTWMLWIEWTYLRFTSANGHIHTVLWNSLWYVDTAKAGTIWIDTTDNLIRWIGTNGYKYAGKYNFQQFWSAFSNWPSPTVVSWQSPWYLWVDSNFWYEHIAYIANDWYKWIFPSWENPYA